MSGTKEPNMDLGSWSEPDCQTSMSYTPSSAEMIQMRSVSRHRLDAISRTIEIEVIPRLVAARRAAPPPERAASETLLSWLPGATDVSDLMRLAISRDDGAASSFIDTLAERGASFETICAELLGPTARLLGEMWEDDRVSFTDVTTGVWRLQQILRGLAPAFTASVLAAPGQKRPGSGGGSRSILLVPAIGEQHSLGLQMVAALFRKEGWLVRSEIVKSNAELAALVRSDWFDVIGFSVGSSDRLEELTASIRDTRTASRNVRLGVMVGGPVFLAHPDFVAMVGADATAADGREAAVNAEQLLTFLAHTR